MGVHGLWKLLEPSGQMVPLESLAGKVLAVDISLWLHQAMKGMHDTHGAPVAVAHILILFHRLCKLLFYKIKPVFVFDGGVPTLKRQTMAARRQQSSAAKKEAMKVREKLIKNLLKHEAVRQVLSNETASAALGLNSFTLPGPSVEEDLYKLPPIATDYYESGSSEEVSSSDEEEERRVEDIHSIDVTSKEFLCLPPEVRHDILTELIDTRKQSSWKHLDAMPKKSDCFSDFQMNRLLKRRAVQTSLEKAGKEMGGRALSLKELETLLGDRGVFDSKEDFPSKRIAQDSVTRYMLVQKDQQDNVSQEKEEDFDIMNHLNDVAWSSDSDTDIILKDKPIVKNKPMNASSGAELSDVIKENRVKTESSSTQPKIRMTKEIAEILTVLEGGSSEEKFKIKIEDLKSKINLINSSVQEENELIKIEKTLEEENLGAEENSSNPKEVIEVVREKAGDSTVPICEVKSKEEAVLDVEVKEENVTEDGRIENKNSCLVVEKLDSPVDDKQKPSISFASNVENVNDLSDSSSSDSESNFIPISDIVPESIPSVSDEMKRDSLSVLDSNKTDREKCESLTVTINPSKINESDDLFADVFQNNERNNGEEKEEEEVEEMEEEEEETSHNDSFIKDKSKEYAESINEYKELEEKIRTEDLENLKESLENEQYELMLEQGKQERHALNVTDQMYSDAQELLRLFGIPFVIAPMEAEAQCAVLNLIGLTEGTITDDSDIWLFGGRVVYKNFFNQNKHVLEFRSENIHKYLKLSREDLIRMALLVGSDYTLGLNGVGPVTALEILASFKSSKPDILDGLQSFRDWYTGRNKTGPPRVSLKKKIKNAILTPGFPSKAVVEAYLHPQVDDSKEPFSWAKPNLTLIQKYTKLKMGWSSEKCSELLLPVLKKLEENTNQYTMEKYFKVMQKTSSPEGVFSKRVESAIKRLGSDSVEETEVSSKPKRRRKCKEKESGEGCSKDVKEMEGSTNLKPAESVEKNVSRNSRESSGKDSKTKLINERLHKDLKVPQKEMTQKMLEERKKQAIRLFKTYKKGGKKKVKVFAKEEVKLSESSSEDD